MCDQPGCRDTANDWGADDLTYDLWLRWQTTHDPALPSLGAALAGVLPDWAGACNLPACGAGSDVPEWDAIAAIRDYQVTGDPAGARRSRGRVRASSQRGDAFSVGACPDIRYQQPAGGSNQLKTLETDGNAIEGRDPALPGDRRGRLPRRRREDATRRSGRTS